MHIEPIQQEDQEQVTTIVNQFWGEGMIVVNGETFHTHNLPGFKVVDQGKIVGILHYQIINNVCEIITLASILPGVGIGSRLLDTIEHFARTAHCDTLRLTTTNDNLNALGFYQKRGFRLVALHPEQVNASRHIKPSIPLIGNHGIPLRDELVLEKHITQP